MQRINTSFSFISGEFIIISKLVFPVYLTSLCWTLIKIVSASFAGHMNGGAAFAAISSCQLLADITGWAFQYNFSSALDTLASQAFGAKNYKYLGVLLQRSILIHLFMTVLTSIIWINTDNILILLYQAPHLVQLTDQFLRIYIFINPGYAVIMPCIKTLQMQDIVLPSALILVGGIILEILLCYIFIFLMDMGVYGVALGEVMAVYAMAVAHVIYLRFSRVWGRIWGGWSWDAWRNWGQYFYYGFPVYVTEFCEVISIQVGGYVVGIVSTQPEVEISVYSILTYLDLIIYIMPTSFATVMAIRIGNLIGDDEIGKVKKLAVLAIITQLFISLIQSVILITGRSVWGGLFSNDPSVISGLAHMVFILVVYHPFDSLAIVFLGILRGAGKQDLGLIMAGTFIIVAFPVAIGLCVGLKLSTLGYFLGIMAGYLSRVCACFLILICCIKWDGFKRVDAVSIEQVGETFLNQSQDNELIFHNQISTANVSKSRMNTEDSNYETFPISPQITFPTSHKSRFILVMKKVVFIVVLLALFIWQLSCKLSSNRVDLHIQNSYLKEPLEICCFKFIPVKNLSSY